MAKQKDYVETPLMKQYYGIKAVHPDAVLLFRVGDFYETFGEDAIKASGILGITLTRRANGAASFVELAGFPYHALDTYLPKLVRAGVRVAVCEQLEDPKKVKGIVKRGVIELVTPGVALGENLLESKQNHFLAAVNFGAKTTGVAFLDISTGEFYAAEGSDDYVDRLMSNFAPREVIYPRSAEGRFRVSFGENYYTYKLDEWVWSAELNREKLCRHFGTPTLKGFGIEEMGSAVAAAGAILYYLEFTEHRDLGHITSIARIDREQHVWLDKFSIRNLELFGSRGRSFVEVMDRTHTPMGGRTLRKWIALPLRDVNDINRRLDAVQFFRDNGVLRDELAAMLGEVSDLERISSRVAAGRAMPREVVQLKNSLDAVARIKSALATAGSDVLATIAERLDPLDDVGRRIGETIYPDPSNQIQKGGVIADGVNMELDDLRRVAYHGREVIASIQARESEATGIPSLKISFNNVFGYYIEVRNTHKDKVPEHWVRKQTLTGAERYITPELKEYEEKILGAEERMVGIEMELYADLTRYLLGYLTPMQRDGAVVGEVDCLLSLAALAEERNYARPELDDTHVLDIRDGRHPVIETLLPVGEPYVPNDVFLDDERQQIMMITGPNMAGKSALLRQTALIVLMAQMGSFVPASAARIGIVDKIFTRVGASDNISQGESTFMVEMLEAASILNNISGRSLLLMDEIGRGTSTYDGISIAWSMVEYLHRHTATHYHELNRLADECERVKNYNVSVREVGRSIVFLRKLAPGGTEHSFGIHVARMAGMPRWVVDRAEKMLASMESGDAGAQVVVGAPSADFQLSMFQLDDPVLSRIRDEIKGLDIDSLTPLEALNKLSEIKKITGQ